MENKVPVGFIYYLQNPVTGEIFYVGATETSLKNRLRTHYQHLSEALKGIFDDETSSILISFKIWSVFD